MEKPWLQSLPYQKPVSRNRSSSGLFLTVLEAHLDCLSASPETQAPESSKDECASDIALYLRATLWIQQAFLYTEVWQKSWAPIWRGTYMMVEKKDTEKVTETGSACGLHLQSTHAQLSDITPDNFIINTALCPESHLI